MRKSPLTTDPLNIGVLCAPIVSVPPLWYGGIERVVFALIEQLVRMGHKVTLFASGDSRTSAQLVPITPTSLIGSDDPDPYFNSDATMYGIALAYSKKRHFDLIHDNIGTFTLSTAEESDATTVVTMHGPFTKSNLPLFQLLTRPYLVTISMDQARQATGVRIASTIYNGLDFSGYPSPAKPKGYLLNVGRISMEKGTHLAIDVANSLGLPLVIAAKLDKVDLPYFKEHIEPQLDGERIKWVREVNEAQRNRWMNEAL
jgi:glycosyltransferase involved in cell wall biosynthesis